MGANKFEYFGTVKFDLTGDTVSADNLIEGYTAHDKAGEPVVGAYRKYPLVPIEYDYNIGYIANGVWNWEDPTNTFTDIYEVVAGQDYRLMLGATVGSRFRAMFTTVDVRTKTSGKVTGVNIVNTNGPRAFATARYTPEEDGYILVAKDNVGVYGLYSYLFYGDEMFV